jgi:3D (Asp-Asp-Asp) domain-containing protein
MIVTAYCPCPLCCGAHARGLTASGQSVYSHGMKLAAADTRLLPFGTWVCVPGYNGGKAVPILDRGALIKGDRLDVLMPTHEQAVRWGRQELDVTIWH